MSQVYLVFSPSGKPILIHRDGHGEEDAAEYAGVAATARALLSFSNSKFRSPLRVFKSSAGRRLYFLERSPLSFLAVGDSRTPDVVTKTRLALLYAQLVGLFTLPALCAIYERQPGYDLRRLLVGSGDRVLRMLSTGFETRPCSFLGAVSVRAMGVERRLELRNVLQTAVGTSGSAYGVIFDDDGRMLSGCMSSSTRRGLCAWDLILLENMCRALGQEETVLSLCLPLCDCRGNFYAYVRQRHGYTLMLLSRVEITEIEVFQRVSGDVLDACHQVGGADLDTVVGSGYAHVNFIFKDSRTGQYVTNGVCASSMGGMEAMLRRYACMRAGMFAVDGADAPVAEQLLSHVHASLDSDTSRPASRWTATRPSHAFRVECVGGMVYVAFASVDAELYVSMDGVDVEEDGGGDRCGAAVELATTLRARLTRQRPHLFFRWAS